MKAQESLRKEKKDFESLSSMERSQLDSWRLDVTRREHVLVEKEAELERGHTELLIAKQMIEPDIKLSHQDRLQATCIRQEAERLLAIAKEEMEDVRRAERLLEEREERLQTAWEELEASKLSFHENTKAAEVKYRCQVRNQKILKEERRKLHACATELSRQFVKLQRSVHIARKLGLYRLATAKNVTDKADADELLLYADENMQSEGFSVGSDMVDELGIVPGDDSEGDGEDECDDDHSSSSTCEEDQALTRRQTRALVTATGESRAPRPLQMILSALESEPAYHTAHIIDKPHKRILAAKQQVMSRQRRQYEPMVTTGVLRSDRDIHNEYDGDIPAPRSTNYPGSILGSLEYSFLSTAATNASHITTLAVDTGCSSTLYSVNASTEAMKSAALKYGITI